MQAGSCPEWSLTLLLSSSISSQIAPRASAWGFICRVRPMCGASVRARLLRPYRALSEFDSRGRKSLFLVSKRPVTTVVFHHPQCLRGLVGSSALLLEQRE